jgi:sulfotransferase family protein
MPIIIGAPRSGTTLLRFMLDSHPELAIPPETGFLSLADHFSGTGAALRRAFFDGVRTFPPDAPGWNDFGLPAEEFWASLVAIEPFSIADGYRAFYRGYAARAGKPRWGDKTPMYCLHLATIAAVLPEARFIHIVRDGRDVALSLRQMWFSPGHGIDVQAEHWRRCVSTAREHGARCGHYHEVRYEELVSDPERVLRAVCEFVELSYAPEMLEYHRRTPQRLEEHRERRRVDGSLVVSHADRLRQQAMVTRPPQPSRIQTWKERMTEDDRRGFEAIAGPLLRELGYAVS